MRILKKAGIKRMLICCIVCTVILCVAIAFNTLLQYKQYQNKVNEVIASIIGEIKVKYPDVDEVKIIQIVNSNGINKQIGKELLKNYGIDTKNVSAILELDNIYSTQVRQNIIIAVTFSFALCTIFVVYIKIRDRKLDKILEYIGEINRKNYLLNIYNNTEDDFTLLRNELYKITVMLKEQAIKEKSDKEAIQNSVSDISHQIKTPLTSISIMLDNIAENRDMKQDTKDKFIYEIRRQIDWINWLVISLLKLSRLEAGTVELKQDEIIVNEFIEQIRQNLAIPLEIKNQKIIVNGDLKTKLVADKSWQMEAITNIIKNCIEHTGENKNIYVAFEETMFYTKIIVKDEGEGIPKEDIRHIFERFYKGKNSSENSVGIGLALAKSIIEKQNGFISVQSKLKEGTTFEIKYMRK